jgi:ACR3 family arsenite transporter
MGDHLSHRFYAPAILTLQHVFANWLVKPFGMAFLDWLFFKHVFLPWIGPDLADP